MEDSIAALVSKADICMDNRNFTQAGKYFQQAAAQEKSRYEAVVLYKKAARAFDSSRETEAAVECYLEAGNRLEKTDKGECFLACWRLFIKSIAGYAWECNFEWRGDDSHDDDHDLNQQLIKEAREKAENFLRQALSVPGVDRRKLVKQAIAECKRRKTAGGWGEGACWQTIAVVTGEKRKLSIGERMSKAVESVVDHHAKRRSKRS